jgi:hypothetical protein
VDSIITKLKHEFIQVIPPTIFFFMAFQIIAVMRDLFLLQHGIYIFQFAGAAIGALVVAKVIVVTDHLPFMNPFPNRPLIYTVLWKAGIYFLATLLVRYLEYAIPFMLKTSDIIIGHQQLVAEIIWPRFWAVQIWLAVLFLFYSTLRVLIHTVEYEKVFQMFFGSTSSRSA